MKRTQEENLDQNGENTRIPLYIKDHTHPSPHPLSAHLNPTPPPHTKDALILSEHPNSDVDKDGNKGRRRRSKKRQGREEDAKDERKTPGTSRGTEDEQRTPRTSKGRRGRAEQKTQESARTSEKTSKWPSTSVCILSCSGPQFQEHTHMTHKWSHIFHLSRAMIK